MASEARLRPVLRAAGPALLAVALCLICYVAGWRGTDWAAQIYRSGQVAHYGVTDWDPGWYGGTYPLNYSLVYPVAAAYLGLWPLAALSSAAAALSFDRLVSSGLGRRPAGSWYFAAATLIEVAIGQLPTLTGEALALGCVVCFALGQGAGAVRRTGWLAAVRLGGGLVLGVLAALTTPIAGSFLALALLAMAVADLGRRARPDFLAGPAFLASPAFLEIGAAAVVMASTAALPVLFPGAGYFPFPVGDLVAILALCAVMASPVLATPRAVRVGAVLYAATSIALFVVPTQMGDNDQRLAAYIGVPLLLCYLPRRPQLSVRPTAVAATVAVVCLVAWDWGPSGEAFGGATDGRSSVAAFYRPLIDELDVMSKGAPVRVEVAPAAHHWESAYVAPQFSLARGWERQLDMAYATIFYAAGPLGASTYRSWLLSNGVSYVALANAPLDYAATSEAALLRSGTVPGLQPVWQRAGWELWRVLGSPGLASGPARVSALSPRSVLVRFAAAGASVVRLRWTPYWSLPGPDRRSACLMPAPGGWTAVRTAYPGQLRLELSVWGADHGDCKTLVPPTGDVRSG
jgi:hypothetical protein